MIIDSHQHVMLPVELQLAKMDEASIDKTILFTTGPHSESANGIKELREQIESLYQTLKGANSKVKNEQYYINGITQLMEHIQVAPDRFLGFGSLTIEGLSESEIKEWIQNKIVYNHLKGIGELTPGTEKQISSMELIFQAVSDYKNFPLWVHTFHPMSQQVLKALMELCQKYPQVPVIFGHMGGTNWMEVIDYAKENKQIYLDLSAAYASIAAKTAMYEIPERCLFSSDAPYGETFLYRQLIEFVSPSKEISQMVLGDNIIQLLQL